MPLYDYECAIGHRWEHMRTIDERNLPTTCPECFGNGRLIIAGAPATICYAQDECSTKHGPEGVTFTGPRQRARWLKEHHREDVGREDVGYVNRRRTEFREEKKKARRADSKQNAIKIAKALGATGDEIVRKIDREPKWQGL